MPLVIERTSMGLIRLGLPSKKSFSATDESLLSEVVDRAALSIRRTQLREHEHRIAEELQRGLLPKRLPELSGVALAAHYQAAGLGAEAGGDWYDAFVLGGDRIGVVVGDVTGRGVRAASTMGQMRSVTRAFALADDGSRSPGEVLTRVNRYQLALAEDELFTLVYAIVEPRGGTVRFANAGHPPPLLRTSGGGARFLEGGGGLMGLTDAVYQEVDLRIDERDMLILYSDGLVERRGESLDVGLQRLAQAVASGPEDPERLLRHVLRQVLPRGAGLHDDVTAMLVGLRSGLRS
jgi:serine phosphatase RsbU (regulator of sigma subunit)